MADPVRGEVWSMDLNPVRGHEQAGRRPVLVVSDDRLNRSRAGLVFVVPLTTRERGLPFHVPIRPPEGGLRDASYIMGEHMRSASKDRLVERWGAADGRTLVEVEDRLRLLLGL
jgi:mRNA interferase MazF